MPMSPRLLRPRQTGFTPRSISGLALWLDAADSQTLYTTDAGPVTAVSSPLDIAGCALWLDASDASSITQSGGLVSQWNDKSGNGRHATQATGSKRPIYTNTWNQKGVVTFQGTDDTMEVAADAAFTASSQTLFIACRQPVAAFGSVFVRSAGSSGNGVIVRYRTNAIWLYQRNTNENPALSAQHTTLPTILSVVLQPASQGGFRDGVSVATAALAATYDSSEKIWLGSLRDEGDYFVGDIAEAILYPSALSTTDRARVEAYLAAKWGISGVHAPATAANDPVGAWLDKSGNGRHATQATAVRRPVIHSATQNNRRVLSFDGSTTAGEGDHLLGTGAQSLADGMTVIGAYFTGNVNFSSLFCVGENVQGRRWLSGTASQRIAADYFTNSVQLAAMAVNRAGVNSFTFDRTANAIGIRVDGAQATLQSSLSPALTAFTNNTFAVGTVPAANEQHMAGRMFELLVYNRVLSGADCRRIEQHLASKWGITLAPQVSNVDAQDWVNRVYANGGTVSATTAAAVNQFCVDIENAGIRDRFFRLNLFCGNSDASLNAVRTPLFRGPSLTGTQYGNATDTNVNFVQGDYSATDGLTSAASPPKYLTTGVSPDTIGTATGHISVVVKGAASSAAALGIGSRSSGAAQRYDLQTSNRNGFFLDGVLDFYSTGTWGATSTVIYQRTGDSTRPAGQYLVTRTSSSRADWYLNGVSVANSTASVTPGANPNEFYVCGINNNGTPFYHGATTVRGYSLGLLMTGSQAAAFSSAFASLNAALGRA